MTEAAPTARTAISTQGNIRSVMNMRGHTRSPEHDAGSQQAGPSHRRYISLTRATVAANAVWSDGNPLSAGGRTSA